MALILLFAFTSVQSENKAIEAQERARQVETERVETLKDIERLTDELESIEKLKSDTEAELEEKTRREAEKKREIERLERELQAKREREAEERRLAQAQRERQQRLPRVTQTAHAQSSTGNTYARGHCTWYVKNRRGDIPNGLGNANMWLVNAQRIGLSTGSEPRVGAVAQTSSGALGHVAIVESVNGDGTVTISEMNFQGWNVISQRTVASSNFNYIY